VVAAEVIAGDEQPVVWLKRAEAAKRLNVSEATLDRLSRRPGFPVFRDGRLVRFAQTALDEWAASWRAPEAELDPPMLGLPRDKRRSRRR
jgi:excisionase family DNA binding protein